MICLLFLQHSGDDGGWQQRWILQRFIHTWWARSFLSVGLCQSPTRQGTEPTQRACREFICNVFLILCLTSWGIRMQPFFCFYLTLASVDPDWRTPVSSRRVLRLVSMWGGNWGVTVGRFTAAPSAPAEEPKRLAVAAQEPCQVHRRDLSNVCSDRTVFIQFFTIDKHNKNGTLCFLSRTWRENRWRNNLETGLLLHCIRHYHLCFLRGKTSDFERNSFCYYAIISLLSMGSHILVHIIYTNIRHA